MFGVGSIAGTGRYFGALALGGILLTGSSASGAIPALGELIFDDEFNGSALGTSWTVSGTGPAPTVVGGEVTISNGTDLQFAPGFLEAPIIWRMEGLRFNNVTGDGSGLNLYIRTTGNGSISTYGGYYSYGYDMSGTTLIEGEGYAQGGLAGYSPISSGGTLDTTPRNYSLALDVTGSAIKADQWGYELGNFIPTLNSGPNTIGLSTYGTASVTCSRVRAYRAVPSATRSIRFITKRTTATLDFSTVGLSAVCSNYNFTTYGTLIVEKLTTTPLNLPRQALNDTAWNVTLQPSNLSSVTTMTHTFAVADVLAAGGDPATLTGYKSSDNGATWTEVPNCQVNITGGTGTFTFGAQSSFSVFAIGYAETTAAREWQLFE